MAKSDLGTKRICPTTGKKFYDLNKNPVISPYTGEVVPIAPIAPPRTAPTPRPRQRRGGRRRRSHAGARRGRKLVSLDEAEAEENSGKVRPAFPNRRRHRERREDRRRDDDDVTFIEEQDEGDQDVTESSATSEGRGDLRSTLNCDQGLPTLVAQVCGRVRGHSSAGRALHGMQEVGGSIPPGSTTLRPSGYAWRSHVVPEGRSVVPGVAHLGEDGLDDVF